MSKFKNSFEQLKNDPDKWRQDSWDRTTDKQAKILNIILKSSYGVLAALCFLIGFSGKKLYFIFSIIALIIMIKVNPIQLKDKYGSKK